ncbi:hypothetical protein [Dyadobacter sp. 3J3]|uniref:hypothetical protein n=1 Tax=Dyadobacter sp. 3J3 TaxID=2606600 RepID=UPI0013568D86|nr:hypothetical protein [Dyadobacter sp. 3J3]
MTGTYKTNYGSSYEVFNGEIMQGKRKVSHLMARCVYPEEKKGEAFPVQAKDIDRNVRFGTWELMK